MCHAAWLSTIWNCIVQTGHVQLSLQLSASSDIMRVHVLQINRISLQYWMMVAYFWVWYVACQCDVNSTAKSPKAFLTDPLGLP